MENFKRQVRIALITKDMTYRTLATAVTEKTGMYCDTALISRLLSGEKRSERIIEAIAEILGITDAVP